MTTEAPSVAVVHDYLTQRGGAERVVLSILRAFPDAPLHTSLFDPGETYEAFRRADVRTLGINRFPLLRAHHRLAFPLLAGAFSRLEVDADVAVCSSSGWAHGCRAQGRKIVYCHSPPKWLYQPDRYFSGRWSPARAAAAVLRPRLSKWDARAAASAHRYLVNSSITRRWVEDIYGIGAEVLPPPPNIDPAGPQRPVPQIEPGFVLCVSRLLPYKNVGAVVEAFEHLTGERLVVVGGGPEEGALRQRTTARVTLLPPVPDDQLRWLYASSRAVLSAAYEDFGLTPLEANWFGKPVAVLRWGGFLDTVVEGETGLFFDTPTPLAISSCLRELASHPWDDTAIANHAARFSEERFVARLRAVVGEEAASAA